MWKQAKTSFHDLVYVHTTLYVRNTSPLTQTMFVPNTYTSMNVCTCVSNILSRPPFFHVSVCFSLEGKKGIGDREKKSESFDLQKKASASLMQTVCCYT